MSSEGVPGSMRRANLFESLTMSAIPPAVQQVLQARQDATQTQIDVALLGQNLDVQRQTGDAIVQMISEVVDVQKQLASGHIDVRV
ncbi:MAG TPA: hypothetical protein DDX19_13705 [Rhodopirellula baltica]|uniref:Uncharacterized protein n=3 Tax=Rhodopirellula baltica TaxID=265606 RepID=Q7UK25_RHOBA|nr:hypothetical protein RBSH_00902 [Rhodopirellula baltica SH28]ELP31207.1 hypothetical protein RBSWK_04945 [Rhodopirellula baltica SWK14]CAD77056.1 hypothetical protein RB10902 [Rhodopirellula baltica SH 1]HBE63764.1 hypothetical protein [Rhodopirellula baltica]